MIRFRKEHKKLLGNIFISNTVASEKKRKKKKQPSDHQRDTNPASHANKILRGASADSYNTVRWLSVQVFYGLIALKLAIFI